MSANREQRRRCANVRSVVQDKTGRGVGFQRVNRRLLEELACDDAELSAFLNWRYDHWLERTASDREAARLVENELYRAAVVAEVQGLTLPEVLARRLP